MTENYTYSDVLVAVRFAPPPPVAVRLQPHSIECLLGGITRLISDCWERRDGDWREDVLCQSLYDIQKAAAKAYRAAVRNKCGTGRLVLPYAHWLLLHHWLHECGSDAVHTAIDWAVKNHPQAYRYELRSK